MTPEIIEMLRLALNSAAGQAKDLARKGCKNSQRFLSEIADAYAALDGWAAKSEEAVARSKDPRWQVLSIPNPHIPTTTLTWAVCRGVAPMLTRDDRERAEGIADALNGLRSDRVLNAEDYEAVEELADRFDSTLAAHVHPLAAPPDEAREASVVTRCYIATEGGSPYANIEDAILHGRLRRIEGCRIVIGEDGTVSISGRHREGMDAEPPAPPTEEPHDLSCAKPNHLYLLKPRRQPSGLPVDRHFDSYDIHIGFVIRVESEEAARLIAATAALNDDNNMHLRLASGDDRPWLYPKSTSCEVVPVEGDAAVVLAAAYPG